MSDLEQIRQAIAAIEAQRAVLGDAVVEASLAALRKQVAELEAAQTTEQRKLVTILFADLVGFTSMADKLDPEDVRAIQRAYFAAVTAPIREQGGVIEKYIGDAVMAVFGLPKAEESDPDRAVLAALEMHTALAQLNAHLEKDLGVKLPRPLQMRIGINTGLAIVTLIGPGDFDVVGDSVNLTSRLQNAAPTGGVLISQDTYRHVRGVFDLEVLEPITVKGKPGPLQVYLVTGARKRSFRTRERGVEGIETRMVGREMEERALQQAYSSAVEDYELQAITIVAEPGLGKSRLLYEFENWVDLQPEKVIVLHGRARLETQRLPYGLLRDLFAFRFGIQDDDLLPEVWRKFEIGMGEFGDEQPIAGSSLPARMRGQRPDLPANAELDSQDQQVHARAHFVGQLLGYDFSASPLLQAAKDDPAQIQERGSSYLSDYFRSVTRSHPILVLLEDLHWADDASLSLIDRLAPALVQRPVIIVATSRPALYERRRHWMEGHAFHRRLDLRPLSNRDSRRLVEEVLQKVQDIPDKLRELVVTNAEGNPFYVEELIKMLIEEDVIVKGEQSWHVQPERLTEIHIPPTLTGVLQARLEGLAEPERMLMQQASVVGRVFWDRALSHLNSTEARGLDPQTIPERLTGLREKEMVYRRENSVFAGAQEIMFKHAMLREVTYGSVLKRMRRLYHRLAAEWLVEVTQASGRVDEYTGLIAEHYLLAEDTLVAGDWLTRAGEHALRQGAVRDAGAFFDRALALLPASEGERRWRAMEGRGIVLITLAQDEELKTYLDELMELARTLKDESRVAEAHARRAGYHGNHGRDREAVLSYQDALIPARRAGNRAIEARALALMSISQVRLGEREAARSSAEQAVEAALESGEARILAKVYNNTAVTYIELGDLAQSVEYLKLSIEYGQQASDMPITGNTLGNLGYQYVLLGMTEQALEALERAMKISKSMGARREAAYTGLNLALARLRAQDTDGALPALEEAMTELGELGDGFGLAAGYTYRGLAYENSGRVEEAEACFLKAAEAHVQAGTMAYAFDARAGLARCALAQGKPQDAREQAGLVWQFLNELRGAGMEFPILAYLSCAQVFEAGGQVEDYRAALSGGYDQLMDRAQNISDPEVRRSFLERVPEHRQLMGLWKAAIGQP